MDMETTTLSRIAEGVFRTTDVVLAYAHGSRICGNPRPNSDLDIAYCLLDAFHVPAMSLRDEILLAARLSERVGIDVDLRGFVSMPLELRGRILEHGRRIYCADEVFRVNLERDTLSWYHDYKSIFRKMHETRIRNLAGAPRHHG
jgi:predicted nucleotidyltransferase